MRVKLTQWGMKAQRENCNKQYLAYQPIIYHRAAYAFEQFEQGFNFTNTNWKKKIGILVLQH